MKQDLKNILQSYLSIYYEQDSILVQRRTPDERLENFKIATAKKIQEYIKNGSEGDLHLSDTPITTLPDGLSVGGNLYLGYTQITTLPDGLRVGGNLELRDSPLSKKYTKEQIKQMYPDIKGEINIHEA